MVSTRDGVIPGNGSDEILTILTRTYLDAGDRMAIPYPSYILYETLSQLQGATCERILLEPDWSFHPQRTADIVQRSRLIFAPNPNSPSGNFWTNDELALLVPERGALILDGAYADFVDPRMGIGLLNSEHGDRIVLTRTLSKSYSLAGIRFGFAMAQPDVVAQMRKVKDSYNCDALSLAAATAAIEDQAWMLENARKIRSTRLRLAEGLAALGFVVVPSEANFVWCGHPGQNHRSLYERLKAERILIRYMVYRDVPWGVEQTLDGLRITVGTDAEIDALLTALRRLV